MKKVTLADEILAYLKGGDTAKMTRFVSKLEKYLNKQIAGRKEEITTLTDKIVDANENLAEARLAVDLEKIKDTDSVESYCRTYTISIQNKLQAIKNLQEKIDSLEDEIKALQELQDVIFTTEAENG